MDAKKSLVSAAVTAALGLGASGAAHALAVSQFVVEDVGSTLNGVAGGGGTSTPEPTIKPLGGRVMPVLEQLWPGVAPTPPVLSPLASSSAAHHSCRSHSVVV